MYFEVKSKEFEEFLVNINRYFYNKKNKVLFDKRNTIKVLEFNKKEYIVKSFKIPHIINKIVYTFFRDTKAKKSYKNSILIGDFAPQAIGYIEFKKYGLLYDSYFISEKFNYDFTIREPLLDENFPDKENILKEFAKFTLELHKNHIVHKDYSPGNILIKKENENYIFKLVDVNRMIFKEVSFQERMDNFSKLWAKDEDLKIIIKHYANILGVDEVLAFNAALEFSHSLKKRKNLKKRLKGREIVD
jgi:serine/threonine protein kinase